MARQLTPGLCPHSSARRYRVNEGTGREPFTPRGGCMPLLARIGGNHAAYSLPIYCLPRAVQQTRANARHHPRACARSMRDFAMGSRARAVVMPPATGLIRPPLLPPSGFCYDFADGGNDQLRLILMNEVAALLGDDLAAPRGAAHKLSL
jgi:hypothetical protein